jgi:hypothetical protein
MVEEFVGNNQAKYYQTFWPRAYVGKLPFSEDHRCTQGGLGGEGG